MRFSNKLSLAILITGMIVLILLSFTIYKISYNAIIKSQSMYTRSIADEVSGGIDKLLHEKVKTALTLANTPIIRKALETSNSSYANLSDEKRKESIKLQNEKWKSIKDPADNFILKFTDNRVSTFLKNQQAILKGEYGEIFLTNKFGALVASTSKLSTLAHGHKYWWLGSYDNGEGAVFFDDRGYDDSVGGYVLGLVVPVRKGTEIIGILKCNLNILGSISELISGAEDKLVGKFKLTRSGGIVVFEEGFEPLSTQIHDSIFRRLESKDSESFIIDDSGKKYLVGLSEIKLTKGEKGYGFGGTFESIDHKKGNTGESWYVICYRQMNIVIAPIVDSVKSIILIGSVIILILVLVSYLIGRKIAQPLATLDKATKEIGKGDFEYRIDAGRNDEFGNLARSFNSMASKLQQTTTSVELLENEVEHSKQTEEALRESEEKYYKLFHSNPQWLHISTLEDGRYVEVNEATKEITGYERDELIGRTSKELGLWADYEERSRLVKAAKEQGGFREQEVTLIKKNGEPVSLLWSAATIEIMGTVHLINAVTDITEIKKGEEALRESEEKYRTILESIEDGYFEVDIAGNFTFFNDSLCKIVGYSKDELMGMNNRQYTDEENAKKLYQTFNKVYTIGKPDKGFGWEIIRKDGTKIVVEASISLRSDAGGEPIGFRGVVRDISEKQRLEAQLQQATKMEAIATLAGGVAHEFNNALMGVMGNIELLKMELPEDERRAKYFEAMNESGHRMSRLTDQLLAYSEGGKYNAKNLKLDDFTIETLPILQHDLSPEVRVETHFPKDISYIRADHAQMQMVLSAILTNSNEAIEDEGIIKITAENKNVDDDFTKQHAGLKPGSYVCLTIEDDGKGMDEETKNRIFEPFFTTKFQGRGMGMAAVYGIIKSHDGAIIVDSEPGKGTGVRIYLPAISVESQEQEAKAVKQPETEIAMGEGTILVIEDEEPLVGLFSEILEMLGYRVLLARTGKEAVELAKTFDGQIDLALLDIKLPDMDGGRVYPLIMEARPDMKVIVCSGYSIHGPAQDILDAGAEAFMQKPFSIAPFAEKLKDLLEGK